MRLLFSGGDFAATLLFDGQNGQPAKCEFELLDVGATTANVLRTLDLLDAMQDATRGATVQTDDGTIWKVAGLQPPSDLDLPLICSRVAELHDVASACGVELRVPLYDDDQSWEVSALISSAIRNQGVVVQRQRLTVRILSPAGQTPGLDGVPFATPGPLSVPYWESLSIGGVELNVGKVWLDMPDAQFVSRTRVEQDGLEMEQLEFTGDLHSYRFECWNKVCQMDT